MIEHMFVINVTEATGRSYQLRPFALSGRRLLPTSAEVRSGDQPW
jgi:hypothetical protein